MLSFSRDWKNPFYVGSFCFGRSINRSGRDTKIFFFTLISLGSSELRLGHSVTAHSLLEAGVLCVPLHDVGRRTDSVAVPGAFNMRLLKWKTEQTPKKISRHIYFIIKLCLGKNGFSAVREENVELFLVYKEPEMCLFKLA